MYTSWVYNIGTRYIHGFECNLGKNCTVKRLSEGLQNCTYIIHVVTTNLYIKPSGYVRIHTCMSKLHSTGIDLYCRDSYDL